MSKSHKITAMLLKIISKKLIVIALTLVCFSSVWAQIPGGKTKASDYSDAEITQMIQKAESAGLGDNQIIDLARARGMSESEIAAFRERVEKIKETSNNQGAATESNSVETETQNKVVEAKTAERVKEALEPETIQLPSPEIPEPIENKPTKEIADGALTSWNISEIFDASRFPAYANGRALKAPDQYIIGVGDEISVSVFGNSYFNKISKVDERGRIDLGASLGKVYVKGLAFKQLERVIKAALSQKINLMGNEVEIDLTFSRQVSVNVTGEVQKPGTYQIAAANTVFNLMVLSGGPTQSGSVRDIQVLRGGKMVYRFDVYEYLMNPQNNLFLEDGDFVLVKPVKKRIEIKGGVLRPGLVELLPNENLKQALQYTGGFSTLADASRITLSRLNGKSRTLYQINYSQSKEASLPLLQDGDRLFVFEQQEEALNKVAISGEVYFPGDYALLQGKDLNSLLQQAGGTTPEADLNKAFVIRTYTDGEVEYLPFSLDSAGMRAMELQARDKIVVFKKEYFRDSFSVEIRGEVRNPQSLPYTEGLNIQTLIDYAGGMNYRADITEVEILRNSVFTKDFIIGSRNTTIKVPVSYNAETGKLENVVLKPEDIVVVRQISNLNDRISVTVGGEWTHPGSYVLAKNDARVYDLFELSGGITEFAYPSAAQLFRKDSSQVVFDMHAVLRNRRSEYNYRLLDGDRLIVPLPPDVVFITNTDTLVSKTKIIAPFISGKRAGFYLRNYSLGFDQEHRKSLLYVQELGGNICRSRHLGLFVLTPKVKAGSQILFQSAPKKKEKVEKQSGKETDWNKIFEGITTKLTAIATLWVLLGRV